jgi:hypothetical protein
MCAPLTVNSMGHAVTPRLLVSLSVLVPEHHSLTRTTTPGPNFPNPMSHRETNLKLLFDQSEVCHSLSPTAVSSTPNSGDLIAT